jgi:hypothetical protein
MDINMTVTNISEHWMKLCYMLRIATGIVCNGNVDQAKSHYDREALQ